MSPLPSDVAYMIKKSLWHGVATVVITSTGVANKFLFLKNPFFTQFFPLSMMEESSTMLTSAVAVSLADFGFESCALSDWSRVYLRLSTWSTLPSTTSVDCGAESSDRLSVWSQPCLGFEQFFEIGSTTLTPLLYRDGPWLDRLLQACKRCKYRE